MQRCRCWCLPQCHSFNPHPTRRLDATWLQASPLTTGFGFNPRNPQAGCNSSVMRIMAVTPQISILTQPAGWMRKLNPQTGKSGPAGVSNPHPTRRLDATVVLILIATAKDGFNPHPARRLDATRVGDAHLLFNAKFQSSPNPQAGCNAEPVRAYGYGVDVSILTQPAGWMQQGGLD